MSATVGLDLDLGGVLAGLKSFQRDTVAHVVDRLYGEDPVDRFLVADEVGLGKTLVAKGVVAMTIDRLRRQRDGRIDVVYICSNQDIARQNLARLNPTALTQVNFDQRLTMLPRVFDKLRRNEVNFVAFTPGTSFNLRSAEGQARERILLYHLLRRCWGASTVRAENPDKRVFQGWSNFDGFKENLAKQLHTNLDDELVDLFTQALDAEAKQARRSGAASLQDRYLEVREGMRWLRQHSPPRHVSALRREFIGDVRELLARTCIQVLDPSLVILDEFQRFRGLLDGGDDTAALASSLFQHEDVKVLLLSATPYKMYTVRGELQDDHYADLLRTMQFLGGDDETARFQQLLRTYRRHLLADGDAAAVAAVKERIEAALRRVMVRTERLAASTDRGGMLVERASQHVRLEPRDVREYLGLEKVSHLLGAGGVTDYWKSTGYPLNFMEGYKLDRELMRAVDDPALNGAVAEALRDADWLLDRRDVEAYRPLDPGNARLRSLIHELLDEELWRVAWMPPSLPYHQPGATFEGIDGQRVTKRLIFSAWKVVPKVIATVLSYEAERRMANLGSERLDNTAQARRSFQPRLRLQRRDGRYTGMPVIGLMYPSPFLASIVDPLEFSDAAALLRVEDVERETSERLRGYLDELTLDAPTDGAEDASWYWAAPMLLDLRTSDVGEDDPWWWDEQLSARWTAESDGEDDQRSMFDAHLEHAWEVITDPSQLGRPPADLLQVVTRLALAGPGTAALRALRRVAPELELRDVELRHQAASVAWAFRSLFNRPEITWLLTGVAEQRRDGRAYWRLALSHALDGNLQAVLDEHAHLLVEWTGVTAHGPVERITAVAERMREALTTRAVSYRVTDVQVTDDGFELPEPYTMRGQFAVRFGDDRSEQDQNVVRQGHVRTAFNSPYWPFVIATTSVGQEGLDFHLYCHAVTHWNLPSNPVDLEQREGRVHRYKGHAIRKNVALRHREAVGGGADPWGQLFDSAEQGSAGNDLVPYWIYPVPGGATIERTVPALPLSSEERRLGELRRTVAAYRLVFGQPRQEDLVAFLQRQHGEELERLGDLLRIDLSPPPASLDDLPAPSTGPTPTWRPPSEAVDVVGGAQPKSARQHAYRRFWAGVLDDIIDRYPDWVNKRVPPRESWLGLPAGVTGVYYALDFAGRERLRAEVYVDPLARRLRGIAWQHMLDHRGAIEERFGTELTYEDLPGKRASRIACYYPGGGSIDRESQWPAYREWAVVQVARLRDAAQPAIDALDASPGGSRATLLAALDDARYAAVIESLFDVFSRRGRRLEFGSAGASFRVRAGGTQRRVSVGWFVPPGVYGYLGMSDLTLGYDAATADELSDRHRRALERYLDWLSSSEGTYTEHGNILAYTFPPAAVVESGPALLKRMKSVASDLRAGEGKGKRHG